MEYLLEKEQEELESQDLMIMEKLNESPKMKTPPPLNTPLMVDLESEISTPSLEKSEIGHRGVNVT